MIHSIQKAMRILAVIADGKNEPVALARIAQETGYPKPTCAHIVETLCADGYAQRTPRGYRLGPGLYHLTRYGRYRSELVELCHPVLRWMERESRATAILAVVENRQKFIIDTVETEPRLYTESQNIRTDELYRTATGRVLLAHMDRREAEAMYRQYGNPHPGAWEGVNSLDSLLHECERVRRQPVETVYSGDAVGMACALVHSGVCLGAVGLGWREDAPAPGKLRRMEQTLVRGVREMQRRLTYQGE